MDNWVVFVPYGSRLGFHENGVASTMANIDHKFPQCVCFQQNQREEVRDMGDTAGALTAESGMHNTNYLCYAIDHVITTGANCTAQGPCVYKDICPTEKAGGVHAVCFQNTGHGWWNQDDIAQTLRTPCGGDSMKANLVMTECGDPDG